MPSVALVLSCAPRRSASAAICERRARGRALFQHARRERREPERAAEIRVEAAAELREQLHERRAFALRDDELRAVRQRRALDRGERELGRPVDGGQLAPIRVLGAGREIAERNDVDLVIPVAQPFARGVRDVLRARLAHPLQLAAVEAGIVGVEPTLREHHGLAGAAADALDAAHEARIVDHAHAIELGARGPAREKRATCASSSRAPSATLTPSASVSSIANMLASSCSSR